MKQITHSAGGSASSSADNGLERRVLRTMAVAVIIATIISAPIAPWRITTGLATGGLLSLLNHHWLQSSISAAFELALGNETKPRIKLAQYILRYFVVGAVVAVMYKLDLVSLAATVAGLCSFVVALLVEAFREFYFAIIHREEIS